MPTSDDQGTASGIAAARRVLAALQALPATLAVAESCTGGLIGHLLTEVPGASQTFLGSAVVYANSAKRDLLQVSSELLGDAGAVSEAVVAAMAEGARLLYDADVAVATSGIAGPGGATPGKAVGTLCLAISSAGETHARTLHLPGLSRGEFKRAAAQVALAEVERWAGEHV